MVINARVMQPLYDFLATRWSCVEKEPGHVRVFCRCEFLFVRLPRQPSHRGAVLTGARLRFPWESLTSLKPRSLRGYQAVCRLHQRFCRKRKTMFGKKTQKGWRRSCFPVSRMFHYSLCISSSSFWHPEMPNHAVVGVTTELHQCIWFRSSSGLEK